MGAVDISKLSSDLDHYRKHGAKPGVWVGFSSLHPYYTMKLGSVTDWTGAPTSGKTEFLLEVLLNTSIFYGYKHQLWMPDHGEPLEILAALIHKYTGKTFAKHYINTITEAEMWAAVPFIAEYFQILDFEKNPTALQLWEQCCKSEYHTLTIDAWKDLNHSDKGGMRDDEYLNHLLPKRNNLAANHNKHFHTVVHSGKTEMVNGRRRTPSAYDLKGGSAWYDNGKMMVTVDRPDTTNNAVDIIVTKAKPRITGQKGQVSLYFDWAKSRYYQINQANGNNQYAEREGAEQPRTNALQSNVKFHDEVNPFAERSDAPF